MKIFNSKMNALEFYERKANPKYWNSHWDELDLQQTIENAENSRFILGLVHNYLLDTDKPILECGCGIGQYVNCMEKHGVKAIGLDYACQTLQRTRKAFPKLNLVAGNALQLPFADEVFSGIWSLGVIEHFKNFEKDGVQIIDEMIRVLQPDGYLFLSFPYMSPLRKMKQKLKLYQTDESGAVGSFYQYALDYRYVANLLRKRGLKIVCMKKLDGIKGTKDEIKLIKSPLQKLYDYRDESIIIKGFRKMLGMMFSVVSAHCIMLICRKS